MHQGRDGSNEQEHGPPRKVPGPKKDITDRMRVLCSCGEDITDLVAQSGNVVHQHKLTEDHKRKENERRQKGLLPGPLQNPAVQAGPSGAQTAGLGPPASHPGQSGATAPPCPGMDALMCGFQQPFPHHYPWMLHSQVDLAVTWTATTAGRLISNRCLRRCGIDPNQPCEECAKLRHSQFIKNLNRPGFLRTAPGPQFFTFNTLLRQTDDAIRQNSLLHNQLANILQTNLGPPFGMPYSDPLHLDNSMPGQGPMHHSGLGLPTIAQYPPGASGAAGRSSQQYGGPSQTLGHLSGSHPQGGGGHLGQ